MMDGKDELDKMHTVMKCRRRRPRARLGNEVDLVRIQEMMMKKKKKKKREKEELSVLRG